MPELLVIDDDPAIRHAFKKAFAGAFTVRFAATAAEAVTEFSNHPPDVVILDVHLPDATGLDTFRRLNAIDARVPVVLITGHGTTDIAIEAIKEGVFEYLLKPLELPELRTTVDRAVRSSAAMRTPATMPEVGETSTFSSDVLLGRCAAMQNVYKQIGRVALQDVTVLIRGESGTGKELVARAIYQHGRRKDKPFLAINCAAIPEQLLESELFGHEKGAFTGADRKRIGKFEQCHGGSLFLDEVGEMTPLTQAKILRVMQEQKFERVGGGETVTTNVRLIAATNADLDAMTADSRFRKDLFFRLNVFTIALPPLRERGDDVTTLAEHYVRRFSAELNKPIAEVAPEVWAAVRAHPWPGNVRELQSVLKQAILRMSGSVLLPDFLPPLIDGAEPTTTAALDWDQFVGDHIASNSTNLYAETLEWMERELLVRVLKHTAGNQLQAAKVLGITRGSLRTKIRSLGIRIGQTVWSDNDHGE
jgi:two-component system, NtrC family, response regulator AtoC